MSDIFFSKFDSEYFSLIIFFKYLFILLLIMISFIIMTLLEKKKFCRTFRAVGHLGTLQTSVKITVKELTAKCQVFYRKIYGLFLQRTVPWKNMMGRLA